MFEYSTLGPADAVLRLRPRRVRRLARLLRAVRDVRARPHRADVRRAGGRDPARRLRRGQGPRVRRPPLRAPRRRVHRPGHRPADPRPDERPHPDPPDRRWSGSAFALSRRRRLRARVLLATAHAAELGGNLAAIRDDLAARHPSVPVVVLAHRPARGLRGRLGAAWQAMVAGHYLATSRVVIVDDYFFPIYVIRPRAGTDDHPDVARQRGVQEGRLQRARQVVRGGRGARPPRPASTPTTTSAWSPSQAAAPHYAEAFRQPLDRFVSRLGHPADGRLVRRGAAGAEPAMAVRRRYGLPTASG